MISRTMKLVTLQGECDEATMARIWEDQMMRSFIAVEDRAPPPLPDVIAVFRSGDEVIEIRARTWDEAREFAVLSGTDCSISIG